MLHRTVVKIAVTLIMIIGSAAWPGILAARAMPASAGSAAATAASARPGPKGGGPRVTRAGRFTPPGRAPTWASPPGRWR